MESINSYGNILGLKEEKNSIIYGTIIDFYRHFLTMAYNSLFTSTGLSTNPVLLFIVQFLTQHTKFKGLVQSLSELS